MRLMFRCPAWSCSGANMTGDLWCAGTPAVGEKVVDLQDMGEAGMQEADVGEDGEYQPHKGG